MNIPVPLENRVVHFPDFVDLKGFCGNILTVIMTL